MSGTLRARFWLEATLAILASTLFVLTLPTPDWIERSLSVELDGGSGALEWAVSAALLAMAVASTALGRAEWKLRNKVAAARLLRTYGNTQEG